MDISIFDPATHDYSIPNIETMVACLLNQNELSVALYDPTAGAPDTFHFSESFLGKLWSKAGGLIAALLNPFGLVLSPLMTTLFGALMTVGVPIVGLLTITKFLGGKGRSSSKSTINLNVRGAE